MKPPCILITGRDPEGDLICSHTSYVRTHAYAASRAGYDVHVICLAPRARRQTTAYGIVHALPTRLLLVRQNQIPFHSAALSRGIENLAAELGGDAVILHGFGLWGHPMLRAHRRLSAAGVRSIKLLSAYTTYLDETDSQWRGLAATGGPAAYARFGLERTWIHAVIGRYERAAYRGADRVLVNYRSVGRMVAARFGNDVASEVIAYSIEQAFTDPPPPSPAAVPREAADGPRIVCIARHDPRKGVDVLLHALHQLKQSGAPFHAQLAGNGPLLEAHRRLAVDLKLGDCVDILGPVPDVEPYLAGGDMLVLPSREEQSGSLALIEGLRAGVACVASACDGIPEDLSHGHDAWLSAPGDAAALAEGIRALIADPALRDRLARAGRATFERRFSEDGLTAALDRVYTGALAGLANAA